MREWETTMEQPAAAVEEPTYEVYIVECRDGTLYTGIARDALRRVRTHNRGLGAKYTRSRLPVTLRYRETLPCRSAALKREYAIKQLPRSKKLRLIQAFQENNRDRA